MRSFLVGVLVGVTLGAATTAAAVAPRLIGEGYLVGWDVMADGETVCSDPYVWAATREIECD